jgi:two-component system, chemotaxis family, protein-glutamate methylesterase/glutaminase
MSIADPSLKPKSASGHDSIRVMIVDDAIVVRGLLVRWIEAEAGLQVVASLRSGREAIEQVMRTNPDVVILDVDMPDSDGITALPRLFEQKCDLVVIMSSTLTRRNAEVSLRALSLGGRLYSQARVEPRDHQLRLVSPRSHRKNPRPGGAPQAAAEQCPRAAVGGSGRPARPARRSGGRQRPAAGRQPG